jgi:hypothetical protein
LATPWFIKQRNLQAVSASNFGTNLRLVAEKKCFSVNFAFAKNLQKERGFVLKKTGVSKDSLFPIPKLAMNVRSSSQKPIQFLSY